MVDQSNQTSWGHSFHPLCRALHHIRKKSDTSCHEGLTSCKGFTHNSHWPDPLQPVLQFKAQAWYERVIHLRRYHRPFVLHEHLDIVCLAM